MLRFPIILKSLLIFIGIAIFVFTPSVAYAASFEILPPVGNLTRGQTVQFTINIDTQSASISTVQIGVTYQTQYLQFVNITPGESMQQVSVQDLGEGRLLFSGVNPTGFQGKGVFAYINFQIIAQSPGSTELCTLFNPSPTAVPTAVSARATPLPTSVPTRLPTRLPNTGDVAGNMMVIAGIVLVITAAGVIFTSNSGTVLPKNQTRRKQRK